MARFTKSKTSGQVRLRKWPPGRVSQLKVLLSTLDKAANAALAGQVTQGSRRVFSEFVPKIVLSSSNVSIEFREVRIAFAPPQGLRRFLFYEFQQSTDSNFSTFETFLSPESQYTFSNLLDEGTYYFRVRVVTTDALYGPWSETVQGVTPAAKAVGVFDIGSSSRYVTSSAFTDLVTFTYNNSVGGTIFYSMEYKVEASYSSASINIADMEFRWLVDSDQQGQNFLVTSYAINPTALQVRSQNLIIGNGAPAYSVIPAYNYIRSGSFIQRPHAIAIGNHNIILQCRSAGLDFRPAANEPTWADMVGTPLTPTYTNGAVVSLKNFGLFEIRSGAI
jgi:hypothetical protein